MRVRLVLFALATAGTACGTSMMVIEAGSDADAPFDSAMDSAPPADTGTTDAGPDVILDCGMLDGDASVCDRPSLCTADPPPDASKCLDELDASCGVLFRLLAECQRKYTVCNPGTCKTDPIKTGTSLQQNCISQATDYQACTN